MSIQRRRPWSGVRFDRSVAAARDGSFSALGQLLEHYRDYLLHIAHEQLGKELVVKVSQSDLVQQTFLNAVQTFPRFAGHTEGELKAWLRQILLNELRDAHKRYQLAQKRTTDRECSLDDQESGAVVTQRAVCPLPLPSEMAVAEETRARVRRALGRLSPDDRQVLQLRTFEGRSFDEVGEQMNRSSEAVRRLWSRAVQRLSKRIDESGHE